MVGMNETAAIVIGVLLAVFCVLALWAIALELWSVAMDLNQRRRRKTVTVAGLASADVLALAETARKMGLTPAQVAEALRKFGQAGYKASDFVN